MKAVILAGSLGARLSTQAGQVLDGLGCSRSDVEVPKARLSDRLRAEQDAQFAVAPNALSRADARLEPPEAP